MSLSGSYDSEHQVEVSLQRSFDTNEVDPLEGLEVFVSIAKVAGIAGHTREVLRLRGRRVL